MPFGFFNKDNKPAAEVEADLEELRRGGIISAASRRLKSLSQSQSGFFTAAGTPSSNSLLNGAGIKAITQVMGSAFIHADFEAVAEQYVKTSSEVAPLTTSYNTARIAAFNRLIREAQLLGADGVVDVKLTTKRFVSDRRVLEFTALGTAVKMLDKPVFAPNIQGPSADKKNANSFLSKKSGSGPIYSRAGVGQTSGLPEYLAGGDNVPFLSHLSGLELWQLYQAGYWPVGIAGGNCTYFIAADNQTRKVEGFFPGSENQELSQFSSGIYHCRYSAHNKFLKDIVSLHGDGAVGVEIEYDIERFSVEKEKGVTAGLLVHFLFLGTAVRQLESKDGKHLFAAPRLTVNLSQKLLPPELNF